jgi:hypothetical protein
MDNQSNQYELDQLPQLLRPPPPPIVTTSENLVPLETKIHPKFCSMKSITGFGVYVDACDVQARTNGLNLPPNVIRMVAAKLWKEEPPLTKDAYMTPTQDANVVIRGHKTQFLPEAQHHVRIYLYRMKIFNNHYN